MGFIQRLLGTEERSYTSPTPSYHEGQGADYLPFSGLTSPYTPITVSTKTALAEPTVYACVNRIATTVAGLPITIKDAGGQLQANHSAYQLLSLSPNDVEAPFSVLEMWVAQALVYGRSGLFIRRDNNGKAVALDIMYGRVNRVHRENEHMYELGSEYFMPYEVLILENMQAKSPVKLHAESIGISLNAQQFGAEYFKSGGIMDGVLTTDKQVNREQMQDIKRMWNNQNGKTRLLHDGFKYQRLSTSPVEAQFLETREYQIEDIARIFGVPSNLVGGSSNVTYSNVGAMQVQFMQFTIMPWIKRIEQEVAKKLFTEVERRTLKVEIDERGMMRGDVESRAKYIKTMLQAGVMSINEAREQEGFSPIEGGDAHHLQVNQVPLNLMQDYGKQISGLNNDGK